MAADQTQPLAGQAPGKTPGTTTPAPVATPRPQGPAPGPGPSASAADTAPKFGGLRGGKPRKDGLIPGSPQAKEADRKKDAERKRKERAPDPAPLPSAAAVAGQAQAQPGALVPVPALAPDPFVPWTREATQSLWEDGVPLAEELAVHQIISKARKARLPGPVLEDIEKSAGWSPIAKKNLILSGADVTAEILNEAHISAKHKSKIQFGISVAVLVRSHMKILSRLDKLIAVQQQQQPNPPNENKNPPQKI